MSLTPESEIRDVYEITDIEKQGIIDGYEVILNPGRFNRSLVGFIHVFLEDASKRTSVGEALSEVADIQEIHFITGKDCFLLKVRVADMAQLNDLIETKIAFIRYVSKTETSVALSTLKESSQIPLDLAIINEPGK